MKTGQKIDQTLASFTREELEYAYYFQVQLRCDENQSKILKMIKDDLKTSKRVINNAKN